MSLSEKKFLGLKPIAISEEDTKLLNEVMNSKLGAMQKDRKIRKITGGLYCVICGGIPTQIATFDCGGATQIERYCTPCVEKQFSRLSPLTNKNKELMNSYNCQVLTDVKA